MTQDPATGATGRPILLNSDDAPSYYVNATYAQLSIYDCVLLLGRREGDPVARGPGTVRVQAKIAMSPQHMKILSRLLTDRVTFYEKNFGPIPEAAGAISTEDEEEDEED
jgi:hypothetical protein